MRLLLDGRARAFEEREGGAGDEDEDGGEERPEERFLPVSVRVRFVGFGLREVDAEQKEDLVHRIRDGMAGLGEHRCAAGERAGHKLAAGDGQVSGHRRENGAPALFSGSFGGARSRRWGFGHSGNNATTSSEGRTSESGAGAFRAAGTLAWEA